MVFSTNTIMNTKSAAPFEKIEEKVVSEDHSFFLESLNLLAEENKQFFLAMSRNCTSEVINEGVAGTIIRMALKQIDPIQIILNILNGFIKLIEKIWRNFEALLLDLCNRDHVIKGFKKKLESIDYNIQYMKERSVYTNLDSSTSRTTYKIELEKEYSTLIEAISVFNQYNTYEKLFIEIDNLKRDIDMSENYFDQVRGRVISGSNYVDMVSKSDYPGELYKFYRNNGNKLASGTVITSNEIKSIIDDYLNNKDIKKTKRDIEGLKRDSKDIQKRIKNINIESYINDSIDSKEVANVFISVLQNKCEHVKQLCDIFVMSLSAKLDAIKEKQIQNREVLYTICKTITKEGL